jgi:hypothetical protein
MTSDEFLRQVSAADEANDFEEVGRLLREHLGIDSLEGVQSLVTTLGDFLAAQSRPDA